MYWLRYEGQSRSTHTIATYVPPKGEVEVALAEIWEQLLEVEGVGKNDDFLALGGTSVSVMVLIGAIDNQFHVTLRAEDVFQNTTLFRLAEAVNNLRWGCGGSSQQNDGAFDDVSL